MRRQLIATALLSFAVACTAEPAGEATHSVVAPAPIPTPPEPVTTTTTLPVPDLGVSGDESVAPVIAATQGPATTTTTTAAPRPISVQAPAPTTTTTAPYVAPTTTTTTFVSPPDPVGPYTIDGKWTCGEDHPYSIDPDHLTPELEQIVHSTMREIERHTGQRFPFAGIGVPAPITVQWGPREGNEKLIANPEWTGYATNYGREPMTRSDVYMIPGENQAGDRPLALHELGHAAGLGHVEAYTEVMHPSASQHDYRSGDLAGFRAIGCR